MKGTLTSQVAHLLACAMNADAALRAGDMELLRVHLAQCKAVANAGLFTLFPDPQDHVTHRRRRTDFQEQSHG